jgi:hypothetical protein
MSFRILALRLLFFIAAVCAAPEVFAHDIDCTPGYSDMRCVVPIRTNAIPAPACPSAPGYSTITPAVWAGYRWTQPTCSSYLAPPSCLPGYTQISPPAWNGSSWSAPVCQAPEAPPVTRQDELNACIVKSRTAAIAPLVGTPDSSQWGGPYASVGWSAYLQKLVWGNGNGAFAFSPFLYAGTGSYDPPQVENDMFWIWAGANIFQTSMNFCFVDRGTAQVIGFYNFADSGIRNADADPPAQPAGTGFVLKPRDRWYNPSYSSDGLYYEGKSGTLTK